MTVGTLTQIEWGNNNYSTIDGFSLRIICIVVQPFNKQENRKDEKSTTKDEDAEVPEVEMLLIVYFEIVNLKKIIIVFSTT